MKRLCLLFFVIIACLSSLFAVDETVTTGINLLNEFTYYISLVKKENSRIGLDNLFNDINNNYSNKNIDEATDQRMREILQTITELQIIDLKRERLEILYDYKKNAAIKNAIPSPLAIIGISSYFGDSVVSFMRNDISGGITKAIQGTTMLASTATSSYAMYNATKQILTSEYLDKTYDLEYDQMRRIDELRINSLSHQNTYAHANGVDNDYILNELLADKFTECIVEENYGKALDYLVSKQSSYRYFPRYWLELADLYFKNGLYGKCIETIDYYNKNFDYKQIYKKNYRYGQILVEGVASCLKIYDTADEMKERIIPWLEIIVNETADDDWYQRYYCAIVYLLFADATDEGRSYLENAYYLLKMNLNTLYDRQAQLNYYYNLKDIKKPNDDVYKKMTTSKQKETEEFYKKIEKEQKKLPQVDPAFIETLKLIIQLIQEYDIGSISDIKYVNEVIVSPQLNSYIKGDKYAEGLRFGYKNDSFKLSMQWLWAMGNHIELNLPVVFLNDQSKIYLKYDNQNEYTEFWNLQRKEKDGNTFSLPTVNISDVNRKGTSVEEYTVQLSFDITDEWKKTATDSDGFECSIKIDTNGCPIILFFAGKSIFNCSLVSISKDYDEKRDGFYSTFEKMSW